MYSSLGYVGVCEILEYCHATLLALHSGPEDGIVI